MFYQLNTGYALRGWKDIPYAILHQDSGNILMLNDSQYTTVLLCNGQTDSRIMLPSQEKAAQELVKSGILSVLDEPSPIEEDQRYRMTPCRHLRQAHWSITGRCNLKCRHCYLSAPQAKYGELSTEECFRIIDELASGNVSQISLTGGEPFVRKDFWQLVDRLTEKGIRITQISTNGYLLNEDVLEKFNNRGLHPDFTLSYDGIGYHDWLRGVDGAEERTLAAIRLLVKNGYSTAVEMSLNRKNIHTLTASVFLLSMLGVSFIKATPTSNSGNWTSQGASDTLTIKELYDAYLDTIGAYRRAGAPIDLMLGGFFYSKRGSTVCQHPIMRHDGCEETEGSPVCQSARKTLYIAADGKVLPCIPLAGLPIQENMPSLLDTSLPDILASSSYSQLVDSTCGDLFERNEDCQSCPHKYICGGGCRAGALITGLPYWGKDETACAFFQGRYAEQVHDIYCAIASGITEEMSS